MKIVLVQSVKKLGMVGEVVDVAAGYVRNFLIPSGLVRMATPADVEHSKTLHAKKAAFGVTDTSVLELLEKINGKTISFSKKASKEGKLFGSVSEKDIVEALSESEKVSIKAEQVKMEHHLKQVGEYSVQIHLAENANATITVTVSAL